MKTVNYSISDNGDTSISNYSKAKPFSSFFPGVAGLYGIPMWAFYVNRGQCISSFGIENKDKAILEFFPANRAYQLTHLIGFRTFLKITKDEKTSFYEPFKNSIENDKYCTNEMIFTPSYLKIIETNKKLNLKTTITYITIPNEKYAALTRKVDIENLNNEKINVEIIDGLPWVNSFGTEIWVQKNMSRTGEAWVEVTNLKNKAPIYKLKVVIADKPEVEYYSRGNFSTYFDEKGLLPAIIDPQVIFGEHTDLELPSSFLNNNHFEIPEYQTDQNYTPCAMTFKDFSLEANELQSITGVFGHSNNVDWVNDIVKEMTVKNWFEKKLEENEVLISKITSNLDTFSSSKIFDNYCKNTFLDNVLRGGLPVTVNKDNGKKQVFHVYSRKHGDLERDYNHFSLQATYFSQGNGNFRDINQNRRNDIWFNQDVNDSNIKTFFNLIQLDGHNPLVYKGSKFYISDKDKQNEIIKSFIYNPNEIETVNRFLEKDFTLGDVLCAIDEHHISLNASKQEFISSILNISSKLEDTEHGEGYWSDHWTYNFDLIESYLTLFPEKLQELLFNNNTYTYYQNYAWINPRSKRYIIRNGKPFQTNNVEEEHEKLSNRSIFDTMVKKDYGKGDIYQTNLYSKMLCLITNKIATLDPLGVGIELEGGKTNWNDSVNGLPGLFGSSTNETLELKRNILFMLDICKQKLFQEVLVPFELYKLIKGINKILKITKTDFTKHAFTYWDQTATLKEKYRKDVKYGIQGKEKSLNLSFIKHFLKLSLDKIENGLKQAYPENSKVINSYFINELTEYEIKVINDTQELAPKKFIQKPTAFFLTAPMHDLRNASKNAKEIYQAVKDSDLYDKKINMYKVCASLNKMPKELGRCTVFSPGWLENESIFLHMEYKYLLEILRSGLYKEFFNDFKKALVPFQDPDVYGRSLLENSSFIVSSANSNEKLHGTGFVARLSGTTAELVHMWLYMNLGGKPFFVNKDGILCLQFKPILASWLFSKSKREINWLSDGKEFTNTLPPNHYAFVLFGKTLVSYQNINLKNTFGNSRAKVSKIILNDFDNNIEVINNDILNGDTAKKVRDGFYKYINITLE